ncbi:MAG: hypothetical protein K2P09_04600 [Erysipelotrichales bacterium]|nr:hypothetical protein [Erysipelotrichales bacterium]
MTYELTTTINHLYENCLYSSIAHAVANIKFPYFSYEQSWDSLNYSFQQGETRGTISFDLENKMIIGAIRNDESHRIKWYPQFKAEEFYKEASSGVQSFATQEALLYLLDDINGNIIPVITTAFYSKDEKIVSFDSDEDFKNHGGEFVFRMMCSIEELGKYWIEQYEFSKEEIELVDHLFLLKKKKCMQLSKEDISIVDGGEEGYGEFVESLREIGFVI